ncbi:endonuclease IV [Paucilactobacillus hokkaidonensis JCM 18461]|uniref:Probable endonuclease 4 n=2 Tax=Paucilactobacillus hokkaidonensis TaxID=1193095 RepID=A0A0A1GZ17_9LACO|nr:deoxyribonuclease IV [Paucilactobacillus hokkaidonensis]KRO10719.1 endonuclease IV [Paucilactobacillus hokkaidonensis]BAP85711.1 endonuclease IV [Paucilactobacillus hokkaidonensis JCM 18461]
MLIGSHVGMKAPKMLLGAAQEAVSYKANTFMIYTGAPQNTRRKDTSEMKIDEGEQYIAEHKLSHIVVHAPYIVNLGNTIKPENFKFGVEFLRGEVMRATAVGADQITLHPGAHVGAGDDAALKQIIKGLNEVITTDQKPQIAIETMAGKGTEVGRTFEQLATIIAGVTNNDKLSVTFDTCHTSDAGYAIKDDFDGVLNEFDHVIGIDRLKVLHLNDSKNEQGSHKDRHANTGMGTIGFDTLSYIAHHPQLTEVPKILESPYVKIDDKHKVAPYGAEIAMLKKQQFDPEFVDKLIANK